MLRTHLPRTLLRGGGLFCTPARALFSFGGLKPTEQSHKERRCFRYPPEHVYSVVSNVREYKYFVPWCIDSIVHREERNYVEAELAVGFQLFAERYTSRVTLGPGTHVKAVAKDTQLFHYLINEWQFAPGPQPNTAWVTFKIDFAFRSMLYAQASGLFFDEVVSKMVVAFEQRCKLVWEAQAAARQRQVQEELQASGGVLIADAASGTGAQLPGAGCGRAINGSLPLTANALPDMKATARVQQRVCPTAQVLNSPMPLAQTPATPTLRVVSPVATPPASHALASPIVATASHLPASAAAAATTTLPTVARVAPRALSVAMPAPAPAAVSPAAGAVVRLPPSSLASSTALRSDSLTAASRLAPSSQATPQQAHVHAAHSSASERGQVHVMREAPAPAALRAPSVAMSFAGAVVRADASAASQVAASATRSSSRTPPPLPVRVASLW